ncbi:putative GIY-YIG endonuclease [Plasmopara halstedii]
MIGSLYKIVCSQSDICYVGSTFNLLKHRMNGHRSNFKRWDEGKSTSEIAIFPYFRQYGPYESQLRAYETLWINKFKKTCVNKVPPFGLLKRQRQQESTRKYWEANKEVLNERTSNTTSFIKRDLSKNLHVNVAVITNIEAEHITLNLKSISDGWKLSECVYFFVFAHY